MDIMIVLYPDFTALDAIGPMEVLSSVPSVWVRFIAEQAGIISNDTGLLPVQVETALDDMPQPDVVVVPGGSGYVAAMQCEPLRAWLRNVHATARWTTSGCTGSLILGACGLLQGARSTSHWTSHSALAPLGATYVRERFVQHDTIITAAGVSVGARPGRRADRARFTC